MYVIAPQGGYSEFQVTGMIEWGQKSIPKKIPRASNKTPKNPWTKNLPPKKSHAEIPSLNFQKGLNDLTRKKKPLEIECLYLVIIHHTR